MKAECLIDTRLIMSKLVQEILAANLDISVSNRFEKQKREVAPSSNQKASTFNNLFRGDEFGGECFKAIGGY